MFVCVCVVCVCVCVPVCVPVCVCVSQSGLVYSLFPTFELEHFHTDCSVAFLLHPQIRQPGQCGLCSHQQATNIRFGECWYVSQASH